MSRSWIRENPPLWDEDKKRIVGASPPDVFPSLVGTKDGGMLAGDWWRVEEDGRTLGYGWMDVSWGDAEILLAVDPAARGSGVGAFILDHLDAEARQRGVRYLYNVVPAAHPDPEALSAWLQARQFAPAAEDGALLRRQVH